MKIRLLAAMAALFLFVLGIAGSGHYVSVSAEQALSMDVERVLPTGNTAEGADFVSATAALNPTPAPWTGNITAESATSARVTVTHSGGKNQSDEAYIVVRVEYTFDHSITPNAGGQGMIDHGVITQGTVFDPPVEEGDSSGMQYGYWDNEGGDILDGVTLYAEFVNNVATFDLDRVTAGVNFNGTNISQPGSSANCTGIIRVIEYGYVNADAPKESPRSHGEKSGAMPFRTGSIALKQR